MMDIRRVKYFLDLCATLNFSQSAGNLNISQPALTKAIHRLEHDLGGKLIRREGKHTHLTPLGKAMRGQFRDLDAANTRAEITAKQMISGDLSELRIGVMCTIGPQRIASFLAQFQKQFPGVQLILLDTSRDGLTDMLMSGSVDCAFVGALLADEQRLRYTELYEERMMVSHAVSHRFAERESVTYEELKCEPFVDRVRCEFCETFSECMGYAKTQKVCAARSDREEWVQSLVRAGMGVSIVPADSVSMPGICFTPIEDIELSRSVSLAVPAGRQDNPIICSFLSAARQYQWLH
jgi:DNA-binding transcriptional LysR family regulator